MRSSNPVLSRPDAFTPQQQPAQGGFVELTFPEAGHYPVVSHIMVDAERGAHGVVRVTR